MDDVVCTNCKVLQQIALDTTIRHLQARGRLALAKLKQDSPNIRDLEPIVERMFRERTTAVRAYREHIDTHTQKAAESGG
jgi:hypothetical protein